VKKYTIFTEDQQLRLRLKSAFGPKRLAFRTSREFPSLGVDTSLILIDADMIKPEKILPGLHEFTGKKIPVVCICTQMDGRVVMELIHYGVVSVLFKDQKAEEIEKELADILYNFDYLEQVKDLAENDGRLRQFLGVVKSLTSDSDINKIMQDIMATMNSVFGLEGTLFFIVKQDRLIHKMELGDFRQDYSHYQWSLTDPNITWLQSLQKHLLPVCIDENEVKVEPGVFPVNTLLLPLVIKERFFGVIAALFSSDNPKISQNDITLLKAFAEQTAVALENAKLYWDVIKAREELIYYEKRNLLNQTIISLNHEINNPLSIISMEAELLHQRLDNGENKMESRIARIEKNIERIKNILERISALTIDNLHSIDYIDGKKMLNIYDNHGDAPY